MTEQSTYTVRKYKDGDEIEVNANEGIVRIIKV